MFGGDDWAPITGAAKYGGTVAAPATAPTALSSLSAPSERAHAALKPWSAESPMFAFGVLAAVTFGLMAFSTSVRVGHTTASVKVGES